MYYFCDLSKTEMHRLLTSHVQWNTHGFHYTEHTQISIFTSCSLDDCDQTVTFDLFHAHTDLSLLLPALIGTFHYKR